MKAQARARKKKTERGTYRRSMATSVPMGELAKSPAKDKKPMGAERNK